MHIGFFQALEEMGLKGELIAFSDIKKHSHKILKENFPNTKILEDITKINEKDIEDFDFLLAGFPCQAFSTAGKRRGFEDTRGTLFFDIARILKEKRPEGFLLENVEGLVTHQKENKKDNIGKTFKIILKTLEDLGYKVSWIVENSLDHGVSQERKRVYILGSLKEKPNLDLIQRKNKVLNKEILKQGLEVNKTPFIEKLLDNYSLKDLEGKAIKDKRGGPNNIHSWDFDIKGRTNKRQRELMSLLLKERRKKHWAEKKKIPWMDGMPLSLNEIKTFIDYKELKSDLDYLLELGYLKEEYPKNIITENGIKKRVQDQTKEKGYNIVTGKLSFEIAKILDPEGICPTLLATDMNKLYVADHKSKGLRKLSTTESLRLFGFPKCYQYSSVNQKEMNDLLGNTVVVPVIKSLSKIILKNI